MKSVLVALGVLAALVASGSATVEQAAAAGMKGPVPVALVVLLEVVNVAGTWTWMTDPRTRVQVEAAAGVAAASIVTGVCGVLSYGLIGLVPAAGVLFTVHLVGRLQHRGAVPEADQPTAVESTPAVVLAAPPKDVDPPNEEKVSETEEDEPETEEVPLPPPPSERDDEQDDEQDDGDNEDETEDREEELDDRGHPVDHRLIPWHALSKEQAQAEARRLTDRGHRVTQSRKPLPQLQADVRDARRALGEEPAA